VSAETVAIDRIAAGGDGVGRLADGRAVFVPRTAPGDVVALDAGRLERRRSYARGQVAQLVRSGVDRVPAPCPHYERDSCGGCQLQHLVYPAQLAVKRQIVGDALRRIGKLDLADPAVEAADRPFRYRTKITLAAGPGGPGLHRYDRPGWVFPLDDCHLVDPRLARAWAWLRTQRHLLPPRLSRLVLRLDQDGAVHLIVESPGAPWRDASRLRAASEPPAIVCWWQPIDGVARVVAGPETEFPATAFAQVNPTMGARARQWAIETLGEVAGRIAWDLYGGTGDTAAALAARGAEVVSVDADELAVAWARGRAITGSVRFVAGRAEDVIGQLPAPHAVVVNPPRAGLHWDVTLRLTGAPVPRLAYVSCDPATLARDLARLSATYQVDAVRAFDLFPQTAHVETVVALRAACSTT